MCNVDQNLKYLFLKSFNITLLISFSSGDTCSIFNYQFYISRNINKKGYNSISELIWISSRIDKEDRMQNGVTHQTVDTEHTGYNI